MNNMAKINLTNISKLMIILTFSLSKILYIKYLKLELPKIEEEFCAPKNTIVQ